MIYQNLFTTEELEQTIGLLQRTINSSGCKFKINNNSKYAIDIYLNESLVDRVNPYSYNIVENGDYIIRVNKTIVSQNVQDGDFISFKGVSSSEFGSGSTTFTGTVNSNITNSTINATVEGNVNANITNSEIQANIVNAEIPIAGDVNATIVGTPNVNISNANIPVSGNVNATITNATVPVSGNVNATIQNASVNVAGNVGITGTPTVQFATGQQVNIGNTPTVNLGSGNTVNIGNTPNVAISGTPSVNISNASIPITGNVGISSGNVNATIQNASLNAQVINSAISTKKDVVIGSLTQTCTANIQKSFSISNSSLAGLYDTCLIEIQAPIGTIYDWTASVGGKTVLNQPQKTQNNTIETLTIPFSVAYISSGIVYITTTTTQSVTITLKLSRDSSGSTPAPSIIQPVFTDKSSGNPDLYSNILIDNVNSPLPVGVIGTPTVNVASNQSIGQRLYNPSTGAWTNAQANSDYIATAYASYTATQNSTQYTNVNYRGCIIHVRVGVVGTGTITPSMYLITQSGRTPFLWTAPVNISGVGEYTYMLYPSGTNTGSGFNQFVNLPLPNKFVIRTTKSDASAWTFGVDVSFLQ